MLQTTTLIVSYLGNTYVYDIFKFNIYVIIRIYLKLTFNEQIYQDW